MVSRSTQINLILYSVDYTLISLHPQRTENPFCVVLPKPRANSLLYHQTNIKLCCFASSNILWIRDIIQHL